MNLFLKLHLILNYSDIHIHPTNSRKRLARFRNTETLLRSDGLVD